MLNLKLDGLDLLVLLNLFKAQNQPNGNTANILIIDKEVLGTFGGLLLGLMFKEGLDGFRDLKKDKCQTREGQRCCTWVLMAVSVISQKSNFCRGMGDLMKPGKKNKETSMPKENLLTLFNRLTKLQTNEECNACVCEMLAILESSKPESHPEDKSDKLETVCSKDLCYTVRRLIKGSASINEGTRRSFATALNLVMTKFKDSIPCSIFVKEFNKLLTSQDLYGTGNPTRGQETALNSARLACMETAVGVYGQVLDGASLANMIKELFEMAETRSFLGTPCFQLLICIQKLGTYDAHINEGLQKAKSSVDLIWFLHEAGIAKENVPALRTFTKEPIPANADLIFPLLNESISYLSEPHKLWFSMIDFAKSAGSIQEFLQKLDQEYIGSDSLQKKIVGVKLISYSLEALPLDKLENMLQLINQLGPKHAKGSKNTLPLNQEVARLVKLFSS